MVEYRQLTDVERERYERNLKRNEDELKIFKWKEDNKQRSLDGGLEVAFLELKLQTENELRDIRQEIREIEFAVRDCKDKLANGVEIKEITGDLATSTEED